MTLNPVPTPEQPASSPLIEPSLADALASIENAEALSPDTRRHWACSLRRIGEALDRPLELAPARWTALRIPVSRLHHARSSSPPRRSPTTRPTSKPPCAGTPARPRRPCAVRL